MLRSADPIVAWVEARGARLPEAFDGGSTEVGALSLLDEWVFGADLVFLGETDHFIHEKSDFRLLFCRYLLSRGWRSFPEELGWSDAARVGRYLRDGEAADLDRLSLFGYRGDLRADRDDRPPASFAPRSISIRSISCGPSRGVSIAG